VGAEEDLRINTLHRFEKHSEDLILEEYSHCEIPAGCGGVVLRWYDPAGGHPVKAVLSVHNVARATVWLDGEELAATRTLLRPGAHVMAVHLERAAEPGPMVYALGVMFDADDDVDLIAGGTPRWRTTTAAPPEGWQGGHDDTGWVAPAAVAPDIVAKDRRYPFEAAVRRGQSIYSAGAEAAWVRVRFSSGAPVA
jgi:hypothetical protein